MQLVGVLLIVLGATVVWLLGIQGLDPQTAINHVAGLLQQPGQAAASASVSAGSSSSSSSSP